HAWNHRIGAVLLDVRVAALVDEARLRIVLGLLGPGADQVVVDRRAAARTAVGRAPAQALVDAVDGQQVFGANRLARILVARIGAAAHGLLGGRLGVVAAGREHQQLLDQAGARSAGGTRLCVLAHFVQR